METGTIAIIGTVCTGLGGLLMKLFDFVLAKRKQNVSDSDFLFGKYKEMLETLTKKTDAMQLEIVALQKEHQSCREENIKLAYKVGDATAENARLRTEVEELKKRL